jgi:hypothetical protein
MTTPAYAVYWDEQVHLQELCEMGKWPTGAYAARLGITSAYGPGTFRKDFEGTWRLVYPEQAPVELRAYLLLMGYST